MPEATASPQATLNLKRFGGEAAWVMAGQASAAIGSIVAIRVLTELIAPATYGNVALVMTAVGMVQLIILGPVIAGILRFFSASREAQELPAFLQAVQRLTLGMTGLVCLLGLIGMCALAALSLGGWARLVPIGFAYAMVSAYGGFLDGMQNAARQRVVVAVHQGIGQWLPLACISALVLLFEPDTQVVLLGYALAAALIASSQLAFFRRALPDLSKGSASPEPPARSRWERQILSYAWPFATWGIFTWAQSASDRWALKLFASPDDVGRFAAIFQLGYAPFVLGSRLLQQLFSPVVFARSGDGTDPVRVRAAHRLSLGLVSATLGATALAALLAFALHGPIFAVFVAPSYRSISVHLPAFVLAGGLFASGQLATLLLLSGRESTGLLLPKITTAIFGVALNLLGARYYGFLGVSWALAATSAVYLVWILVSARLSMRSEKPSDAAAGFAPTPE